MSSDTDLYAAGYFKAELPGSCALCGLPLYAGSWIRRMPDGWRPESTRRYAHRSCAEDLAATIRARVARAQGGGVAT
jgi:hypothetical protein